MSKELIWKSDILLVLWAVIGLWAGEGYAQVSSKKPLAVHSKGPHWQSIWSKKMQGAISELAVSPQADVVIVATLPDSDSSSGKTPLLLRLGKNGQQHWQVRLKSPVREMDLSPDGSLLVVSHFDHQLQAYGSQGELLWNAPLSCKPIVLQSLKKILCYHDDHSDSQVAFDVLDWRGKKILSHPTRSEVVALKVAADQKQIGFVTAQGEVRVLNSEFQIIQSQQIEGEVIDVAVASSVPLPAASPPPLSIPQLLLKTTPQTGDQALSHPQAQDLSAQFAVLYRDLEKNLKVSVFNSSAQLIQTLAPSFKAQQLELSAQGSILYYYGNTSQGQWVGSSQAPFKKEDWKRGEKIPSDYIAPLHVGSDTVWMGYEKQVSNQRESRLLALNTGGDVSWDLSIPKASQAYIYTHHPVFSLPGVLVATDDGKLSLFQWMNP